MQTRKCRQQIGVGTEACHRPAEDSIVGRRVRTITGVSGRRPAPSIGGRRSPRRPPRGRSAVDELDRVLVAEAAVVRLPPDLVAEGRQLRPHAGRQLPVRHHGDRRREPPRGLDDDARQGRRGPDVGAAVHQRRHQLDVDLRLDVAAHRPRDDPRPPLAGPEQHPRQQRVGGPLARREDVRVPGVEAERRAAVLEVDAGRGVEDAGPEPGPRSTG